MNDMETIRQLAIDTWPVAYGEILSKEQLDFMLEKFYSVASLHHQISILKHQFILAFENENPVGFASFAVHENDHKIYHLQKLYVLPAQQGNNIGNQLINFVIDEIKKYNANSLQLNVNRNNVALHFYEKQGFKIIREEDIDIGNGFFMNDYVMEKKV